MRRERKVTTTADSLVRAMALLFAVVWPERALLAMAAVAVAAERANERVLPRSFDVRSYGWLGPRRERPRMD